MKIFPLLVFVFINYQTNGQTDSISYNYLYVTDSKITSEIKKEAKGYINPFGPVSTIKFEIPYSMVLKISLFKGKQISDVKFEKDLFENTLDSGLYKIDFDCLKYYDSGVYFFKFERPDTTYVIRTLLVN
ncbi:MAG TPA: hypothetical protein PKE39_14120 [Ignavibacteria bacterium]|nr:hypothetical protein [Ignavibacteria bacterium]HMR00154.1 hypothetical protein [Ignavibacteria bacterium]